MKEVSKKFVNNLRYLCLVSVIALGLIAIVGTGGGGGGGGGGGDDETDGTDKTQTAEFVSISIIGLGESILTTNTNPATIKGIANSDQGIKKVEYTNETIGVSGNAGGTAEWSAVVNLTEGDNNLVFRAIANDDSEAETTVTITCYEKSTFTTPLTISDSLIYVNEPQDITFLIGILSDTVDSVTLYETDQHGIIQSEAGTCKDDGVLPDEIDKDGLYTIKRSISSSEEGYLHYRVAVKEGDGSEYYSETIRIWVTSHFSDKDIENAVNLADNAIVIYELAVGSGKSLEEAAEIVVAQLKADPDIAYIGTNDGGGVGWITAAGILGGYHPTTYDQQDTGSSATVSANSTRRVEPASSTGTYSSAAVDEKNEIKSNKAIIISPYIRHVPPDPNGDFGDKDNYYKTWPTIKNSHSCKLYAAKEEINDVNLAWSLDAFKNLSDYGYIHICTHGFPYRYNWLSGWKDEWGTSISAGWGDVGLYTGIRLQKNPDGTYDKTGYENDLKAHRLAIYTNGTLAIVSSFIKHYIKGLPNSLVVLSACYSMYNSSMADAFRAAGAGAVIGFEACSMILYSGAETKTVLEELYKDKTVKEAYDIAKSTHSSLNIEFAGNENLILSGKLKNAGFEAGVLTPWTKAGDGRVLTHLGYTKPTEGGLWKSYMAVISTGLGYTTTSGAIDQSFCMPANAKTLTFDWNFFSEEFREYCGSSYQDSFVVKMYAYNPSTGDIEFESELFNRKIDDLCGMVHEADVRFDKSFEGCEPSESNDCKVWSTGWQKASLDVSAFADKPANLRFYAVDIGDSSYDSAILIDNIAISGN